LSINFFLSLSLSLLLLLVLLFLRLLLLLLLLYQAVRTGRARPTVTRGMPVYKLNFRFLLTRRSLSTRY
jgi:hypothetical protein